MQGRTGSLCQIPESDHRVRRYVPTVPVLLSCPHHGSGSSSSSSSSNGLEFTAMDLKPPCDKFDSLQICCVYSERFCIARVRRDILTNRAKRSQQGISPGRKGSPEAMRGGSRKIRRRSLQSQQQGLQPRQEDRPGLVLWLVLSNRQDKT